jgi:hypothetical protein
MDFTLKWEPKPFTELISHPQGLLLTGSCFTEHIGNSLAELKFNVLQNPNGILFDTLSVCRSLTSYIENQPVTETELFHLNELFHHWQYHSRYSHPNKEEALLLMNQSRRDSHAFLKTAAWVVLTLGSSFAYKLTAAGAAATGAKAALAVANCHKAPAQWFEKYLIPIEEQVAALDNVMHRLRMLNPAIKIIFTVSPVRHIRDGVVENNRSKARLLEAVHHLVNKFEGLYYFPAYELVIDVLRDYRFYDIDLVHPNYAATGFVLEQFTRSCVDESTQKIMEAIRPVVMARRHKALHPQSLAHHQFLLAHLEKAKALQQLYPHLDLQEEIDFFGKGLERET